MILIKDKARQSEKEHLDEIYEVLNFKGKYDLSRIGIRIVPQT